MTATCDEVGLSPEETEQQLAKWERGRWNMAMKWHKMYPAIPLDDLYMAVTVGFLEAAKRYRKNRAGFSTYAFQWAFKEVMDLCLVELGRGINYPQNYKLSSRVGNMGSLDFDVPACQDERPSPRYTRECTAKFWEIVAEYLPENEYDVLYQAYAKGKTHREIAGRINRTKETVRNIIFKAVVRLRRIDRFKLSQYVEGE